MRRALTAIFAIALVWYLMDALAVRVGFLAAAAIGGLGVCALWLLVTVLIAVVESPEEPR